MKKILLTGGSGFVGRALIERLCLEEYYCTSLVRRPIAQPSPQVIVKVVDSLDRTTDYSEALKGQQVVIHCAARVHVMHEEADNALLEFRKVNVEGTINLARQAAASGVTRFIFVSSVKVNGEVTERGAPFTADQEPKPVDPYGVSKLEAELALRDLASKTGMEVTIIRPVLVYGPGVKANFLSMMRWLDRRVPLPFGSIHNRRSFIAVDNLVDLVVTCIEHPAAANNTFLASDGEDLSTTELLRRLGGALGKPARLIPVPVAVITFVAKLLRRPELAQRLCGSLQVDISKTRLLLGWTPPVSINQAMLKTTRQYLGRSE